MLAEFNLLLHEMSDSLLGRHGAEPEPDDWTIDPREISVIVTGLASAGKTRLVEALERRLRFAGIVIRAATDLESAPTHSLHVHAESDFDALIEGRRAPRHSLHRPDVVVPVDWEPADRSVTRVIEQLIARGIATAKVGG